MLPIPNFESHDLSKSSILCVIDFREGSREAVKSGVTIAHHYQPPFTILYPYRLNQIEKLADASKLRELMDVEATKNFDEMTKGYLPKPGVTCEFRPEVGFPQDRIYSFIKKNKVGLLILSKKLVSNNREGLNQLFDQIQIPVLIVPQIESI